MHVIVTWLGRIPENNHEIAYGLGDKDAFPALRLTPVIISGTSDNPVTSVSLLGNAINSKGTTPTCDVVLHSQ